MLPIKRALLVAALFSGSVLLIPSHSALAQDQDHDRSRQGDDHDKDNHGNGDDNGRHNGDKHRDGNNNDGIYKDSQHRDGNNNGIDRGQARSNQVAYNNGMRDGSYDAQRDLNNHRGATDYTKSQRYGNAAGWNAQMGDRNQYKQAFRQGYAAGYQQTFNRRRHGR